MAAMAASLAALALFYVIVRVHAPYVNPALALVLPPHDPSVLGKALPYSVANPNLKAVDPEALALGRRIAPSAPLAFEPFFVEGRHEDLSGRVDRAIALMEEAKRRRPSYELTRIVLVALYQRAQRYEELLTEIDFVLRRNHQLARIILPELAKLIADPRGREAVATIMARDPEWRPEFFEVAALKPGSAADALALLNRLERDRDPATIGLARQLYLQRLVQAGENVRARQLWLETLPPAERSRNALLFNGGFGPRRAQAPFGWTVHQRAQGRAEIVSNAASGPYLDVVYFGGSNLTLAEQQLALQPGRYRLAHRSRSDQPSTSGSIYWRLNCLRSDAELARLRASRLQPQFGASSVDFVVPAGCSGQQLVLIAEPGDISAEIRVQLAGLELSRAN